MYFINKDPDFRGDKVSQHALLKIIYLRLVKSKKTFSVLDFNEGYEQLGIAQLIYLGYVELYKIADNKNSNHSLFRISKKLLRKFEEWFAA
jgi:hypothetical protein